MTVILGLDPGLSTGWSVWFYDAITPPQHIAHGTILEGHIGFIEWWYENQPRYEWDEVVCESFVLDGRTEFPEVDPLRTEGALAVLWPETMFQRNVMKAHMTDKKIKELGLWWPGKGHDRDSLRHVWANLKMRKHAPTIMLAFPPHIAPVTRLPIGPGF